METRRNPNDLSYFLLIFNGLLDISMRVFLILVIITRALYITNSIFKSFSEFRM